MVLSPAVVVLLLLLLFSLTPMHLYMLPWLSPDAETARRRAK